MDPRLNIAVDAARKAGKLIANAIDRIDKVRITEKAPHDFVTDIDTAAQKIIIDTLRTAYPGHGFLGEEGEPEDADRDLVWIIDPLDGTTNFIHRIPHVAISIALREKGKTMVGLVYDPLQNELFTACRNKGAQLNGVRIRVNPCHQLDDAVLGMGFPGLHPDHIPAFTDVASHFFQNCSDVRTLGAAALDLAYVASGRLDGFWELGLAPWDIAAGALLVKEAGGLVGDFKGGENYLDSGNIVCANPKLFRQMLQTIQPHFG